MIGIESYNKDNKDITITRIDKSNILMVRINSYGSNINKVTENDSLLRYSLYIMLKSNSYNHFYLSVELIIVTII